MRTNHEKTLHLSSLSITMVLFAIVLLQPAAASTSSDDSDAASGTWFEAESINPSLPPFERPAELGTPQACIEFFTYYGREGSWNRAAHALNFRLLGEISPEQAAATARKLHYLLKHNLWIDWGTLPDRPDGLDRGSALTSDGPMAGQPRRSIHLGSIDLDGREIPIRIERVKAEGSAPRWLFAAHTVDHVDALYRAHGPSWIADHVPRSLRDHLIFRVPVWQWLMLLILLATSLLVGWLVASPLSRAITSRLSGRGGRLTSSVRWPIGVLVAAAVLYITVRSLLNLPAPFAEIGLPLLFAAVVLGATWVASRLVTFFIHHVVYDWVTADTEKESIDKYGTAAQLTVARYALVLLIFVIGVSVLLMSMDMFRTLGIALLSSAGAAAVVIGIAGHAVLGNLIVGMQIAITRPFRIGDTVFVEHNWGKIEELRYTYVVVRTWDHRRLVFPVKYFINHWFDNWSKTDSYLIKPIYLKVDYRADVQAIREQFNEFVRADEDFAEDRKDPEVLVTECGDETMTVRLTCGAANPSDAWYLSCRIREKMIAWLQNQANGAYLPRQRLAFENAPSDGSHANDAGQVDRSTAQPQHAGRTAGGDGQSEDAD